MRETATGAPTRQQGREQVRRHAKTPAQLTTELAYYRRILATTRSADRRRRAERAITRLERQFAAAREGRAREGTP